MTSSVTPRTWRTQAGDATDGSSTACAMRPKDCSVTTRSRNSCPTPRTRARFGGPCLSGWSTSAPSAATSALTTPTVSGRVPDRTADGGGRIAGPEAARRVPGSSPWPGELVGAERADDLAVLGRGADAVLEGARVDCLARDGEGGGPRPRLTAACGS